MQTLDKLAVTKKAVEIKLEIDNVSISLLFVFVCEHQCV